MIETKLDVTSCTDEECMALAVHQLEGTARWDSYCDSHADPAHINWDEFAGVFHDHHIPLQLLIQKAQEFRTMTQGTMTVVEYEHHFTRMMRYAPYDTSTDEKKQFWFRRGLHHRICQILAGSNHQSLRVLVNCAISVEDERLGWEGRQREKKRKAKHQSRARIAQKPKCIPLRIRDNTHVRPSLPNKNLGTECSQLVDDKNPSEQTREEDTDNRLQLLQKANTEST